MYDYEMITDKINNCEYRKKQFNKGNICGNKDYKCLGYYKKGGFNPLEECKVCSEFFKDYKYSDENK